MIFASKDRKRRNRSLIPPLPRTVFDSIATDAQPLARRETPMVRGDLFDPLLGRRKRASPGLLWKWTVNRSRAIGSVFARIKEKLNLFPREQDCGAFLNEFLCVVAEYDDYKRNIKFTHPETQHDDALHATTYAQLVAVRTMRTLRRFD